MALEAHEGAPYLALLRGLLSVARPSSLFPDAAKLRDWLGLLGRPLPRGARLVFLVHPGAGFPARSTLSRLLRLQFVARDFFTTQRLRPDPTAREFSQALAAASLPPISSLEARLVSRARGADRFVLVYDRLDALTGCPVRFTLWLDQHRGKLLTLKRGDLAAASTRLVREVAFACEDTAELALTELRALDGLTVTEVVRGQLGPLVTPLLPAPPRAAADAKALRGVLPGEGAVGVLSLALERAGESVTADSAQDPWTPLDTSEEVAAERASLGIHVSLERRLVCSPALEPALRALIAATNRRVLLRST